MTRALLTLTAGFACLLATVAADCGSWHCDPRSGQCQCDYDPIPCTGPGDCADRCPPPGGQ